MSQGGRTPKDMKLFCQCPIPREEKASYCQNCEGSEALSLASSKELACRGFLEGGRRQETPGSDKSLLLSESSGQSISSFVSAPGVPNIVITGCVMGEEP